MDMAVLYLRQQLGYKQNEKAHFVLTLQMVEAFNLNDHKTHGCLLKQFQSNNRIKVKVRQKLKLTKYKQVSTCPLVYVQCLLDLKNQLGPSELFIKLGNLHVFLK